MGVGEGVFSLVFWHFSVLDLGLVFWGLRMFGLGLRFCCFAVEGGGGLPAPAPLRSVREDRSDYGSQRTFSAALTKWRSKASRAMLGAPAMAVAGQGSRTTVEAPAVVVVPGQGSTTTVEAPAVVVVPGQGAPAPAAAGVPGQGSRTTVEAQAVAVVARQGMEPAVLLVVVGGVKAGTNVAKAGLSYPKTLKPQS